MADICVIGGGPAGSAFAVRMAQLGHDVSLVERAQFPRNRLGESLSPGVLPLLEATGARAIVEESGFTRVRRVDVKWGEGASVREDPREEGLLVDRARFDRLLLERARALGVRVLQPASIRERRREAGGWRLRVHTSEGAIDLRADFIADATGRSARLASQSRSTPCRTVALYAYWRGARLPEAPRIEAGRDAWYWGVPLPDETYNTLAFVDLAHFRALRSAGLAQGFHDLLARSGLMTGCRDACLSSAILAADATPYLDDERVSTCSIKVGDAALAIDPISSSGVQKAIQSALSGAIVANTLLRKPEARDAAMRFYRDDLLDAAERHRRWAAGHYRTVAVVNPRSFWLDRARAAEAPAAEDRGALDGRALAHARVALSDRAELVEVPCLDAAFVTVRKALRHPRLERPVAYLGGHELAPLLASVRPGDTPLQIARGWSSRMAPNAALAITAWLLDNGILEKEPAGTTVETMR